MSDEDKIIEAVERSIETVRAIHQNIVGECIGVSQALDDLRKSLDEIESCLTKKAFTEAADLGYRDVASAFIFLQRALAGLQSACLQKEALVSEIALQSGIGVYETVAPYVERAIDSSA